MDHAAGIDEGQCAERAAREWSIRRGDLVHAVEATPEIRTGGRSNPLGAPAGSVAHDTVALATEGYPAACPPSRKETKTACVDTHYTVRATPSFGSQSEQSYYSFYQNGATPEPLGVEEVIAVVPARPVVRPARVPEGHQLRRSDFLANPAEAMQRDRDGT